MAPAGAAWQLDCRPDAGNLPVLRAPRDLVITVPARLRAFTGAGGTRRVLHRLDRQGSLLSLSKWPGPGVRPHRRPAAGQLGRAASVAAQR